MIYFLCVWFKKFSPKGKGEDDRFMLQITHPEVLKCEVI